MFATGLNVLFCYQQKYPLPHNSGQGKDNRGEKMPIIRSSHDKEFTIIKNSTLREKGLSLRARGLLAYMLSFCDEWKFSVHSLANGTGESEYCVKKVLAELEKAGFFSRRLVRDERGRIKSGEYTVQEEGDCREREETSKNAADTFATNGERLGEYTAREKKFCGERGEVAASKGSGIISENAAETEEYKSCETQTFRLGQTAETENGTAEFFDAQGLPSDGKPSVESPSVENPPTVNCTPKKNEYKRITKKRILSQKESKRAESFDEIVAAVADAPLRDALREYIQMRFYIKKPPTNAALKHYIERVYALYPSDTDLRLQCVRQSVLNSRPNAFPLSRSEIGLLRSDAPFSFAAPDGSSLPSAEKLHRRSEIASFCPSFSENSRPNTPNYSTFAPPARSALSFRNSSRASRRSRDETPAARAERRARAAESFRDSWQIILADIEADRREESLSQSS